MVTRTWLTGTGRVLDAYSVRARWSPIVLAALPPILLAAMLLAGLPAWHKLWPVAGAAAVLVLIDQLGRDAGKRLQPALWASWGGAPTTMALRYRDSATPVLLTRRHEQLRKLTGLPLPTRDQELADTAGADSIYEAATAVLIARTRSRRADYPLIFTENCNYGFRRNMLGLRPWGMLIALLTALASAALLATSISGVTGFLPGTLAVPLAFSVVALVIWWRVVTPDWVRRAGQAYADRLLEAAETLT